MAVAVAAAVVAAVLTLSIVAAVVEQEAGMQVIFAYMQAPVSS